MDDVHICIYIKCCIYENIVLSFNLSPHCCQLSSKSAYIVLNYMKVGFSPELYKRGGIQIWAVVRQS